MLSKCRTISLPGVFALAIGSIMGQGFPASSINWSLPAGGRIDGGVTYGFNALGGATQDYDDTGLQNWGLGEMSGDNRPDLVVPAPVNNP